MCRQVFPNNNKARKQCYISKSQLSHILVNWNSIWCTQWKWTIGTRWERDRYEDVGYWLLSTLQLVRYTNHLSSSTLSTASTQSATWFFSTVCIEINISQNCQTGIQLKMVRWQDTIYERLFIMYKIKKPCYIPFSNTDIWSQA